MLQGKVDFSRTPYIYSSAKICLSIQTSRDQLSNRTLDIVTSGGFLLTSNTEAVRKHLPPGVYCDATSSPAETVEKIKYYLQNDNKRREIAEKGQKYALEHFTYQQKLHEAWPQLVDEYELFQMQHHLSRFLLC